MTAILIALGGGLGAALRYITDSLLQQRARMHPALSILLINALGSLALGIVTGMGAVRGDGAGFAGGGFVDAAVTLIIGGCGGFTTFSTASLDTFKLLQQRRPALAIAHALGQLVLCVALAFVGYALSAH